MRRVSAPAVVMLSTALFAHAAPRPQILAHYMPWFQTKAYSGAWGYHWSMGRLDPDTGKAGSWFRPSIGLYDSGDPKALKYQFQLMKIAGIDGVVIDWYGVTNAADYSILQKNTLKAIQVLTKVGLKYAMVYEDHTVRQIQKEKKDQSGYLGVGEDSLRWLAKNCFKQPNYIKAGGKPLLLVFGPAVYKNDEWKQIFGNVHIEPAFYTLRDKLPVAEGAFAWPFPQLGLQPSWTNLEEFYRKNQGRPMIATAFPRFQDFYDLGKSKSTLGLIPDDNGKTLQRSMTMALESGAPMIQLVTWNDWGEGTQFEPSAEFGYRDLVYIQATRRKLDPKFPFRPRDFAGPMSQFLKK